MLERLGKKTLQHIIESSPIGLLLTDNQGQISWVNHALSALLNGHGDGLVGKTETTIANELRPLFASQGIIQLGDKDQPGCHLLCTAQPIEGGLVHFIHDASTVQNLVREREELKALIREIKAIDELTGMPDRRALFSALEPQVSRSRRYGNILSILIVHMHNLNDIRQQLGENQTDDLLIACSHMLNDQVRWADMIGRVDDNEFLLILPETSETDTHKLKNILGERFGQIQVGDMASKKIKLKVCFGTAQWEKGYDVGLLMQHGRENLATEID